MESRASEVLRPTVPDQAPSFRGARMEGLEMIVPTRDAGVALRADRRVLNDVEKELKA